jgi:Flp pilus assembly protein TadG
MSLYALLKLLRVFGLDRRANVGIMFGLMAMPLSITVGIGIDYGLAANARTKLQSALDAALLAGAEASSAGAGNVAAQTVAIQVFDADVENLGASATPSFSFPPGGPYQGSATYTVSQAFGALVAGSANAVVGVRAEAAASGAAPVCILLLDASASPGLTANGGANVNAANCEADVKSTGNPAATFNSGSNITTSRLCVQGVSIVNNGGTHPNLKTGCSTVSNPFVGKLPAPLSTTCSGAYANGGNFNGGTVNLTPGVYCGGFNFNGSPTVSFAPGVYVIKGGGWNVNGGTWSGAGVTFYFADSSNIQFNSGMSMTLSAPTSGTYAGILFYEADGLALSSFVFDDSVSESLSGLIYLPRRQLTFNSTSNLSSQQLTLVADTAIFNSTNWTLTPSATWSITNSGGAIIALTQ